MEPAHIDLCDGDTCRADRESTARLHVPSSQPTARHVAGGTGGGWMRRRSRKTHDDVEENHDSNSSDAADAIGAERSPSSLTPPPSGIVARGPVRVALEPVIDIRTALSDDGEDDPPERHDRAAAAAAEKGPPTHDAFVSHMIETIDGAVADAEAHPEPETPNACALNAAHRLARLDGMPERLAEAIVEHRRHRAQQPGGHFSKTVQRRARSTKANEFVRERFRIAQALAKHYNELFHPRGHRFVGRPEASTASQGASTATRGFRARMALFWLDTLVRFDRTFNVAGDLPAPSVAQPLSAREMVPLCDNPTLAAASLADKFDPPDERARQRKRPPPRPTARVDFAGADGAQTARRQRRRTHPVCDDDRRDHINTSDSDQDSRDATDEDRADNAAIDHDNAAGDRDDAGNATDGGRPAPGGTDRPHAPDMSSGFRPIVD